MRLADCRWVEDRQDLILTGPCGSGKSFLASMLGQGCIFPRHLVSGYPPRKEGGVDPNKATMTSSE